MGSNKHEGFYSGQTSQIFNGKEELELIEKRKEGIQMEIKH